MSSENGVFGADIVIDFTDLRHTNFPVDRGKTAW